MLLGLLSGMLVMYFIMYLVLRGSPEILYCMYCKMPFVFWELLYILWMLLSSYWLLHNGFWMQLSFCTFSFVAIREFLTFLSSKSRSFLSPFILVFNACRTFNVPLANTCSCIFYHFWSVLKLVVIFMEYFHSISLCFWSFEFQPWVCWFNSYSA